jgi:prepilin-type N-terminal cleavage/methylation domain-containing protein
MKSAPRTFRTEPAGIGSPRLRRGSNRSTAERGFTLAEVLAALLMMAIIVPVAMEGMSVASRIGVLGQRKVAAMRVAERVLNELIVEGQTQQSSASGTALDGETSYPWTMRSQTWPEDAMLELVVTVSFTVQGSDYDVSTSTLIAPGATVETVAATP